MVESRKKKSNGGDEAAVVQRLQGNTAGDMLRAARIQKGVGLEEISAAINVRVGQLRAIEEGNLDALPGMTYATGFVKSYAGYLKLNSAEIVQKFKAEHGAAPSSQQQPLQLREPLPDAPRPSLFVVGVAGFCVALAVAAWMIFAGGEEKAVKQAEQIPQAPAVGTVTGLTKTPSSSEPVMTETAPPAFPSPQAEPAKPDASAATSPPAVPAGPVVLPVKPTRGAAQQTAEAAVAQDQQQQAPPPANVIKIKSGRSRITLSASQPCWVRITGTGGTTVFEKVLRPGDQYFVPDQPDLSLTTSNAGGLVIAVDGAEVQQLGIRGEIVHGVDLIPDELKIVKTKVRHDR